MKALILAAGRGERMRPLTDTTPKPLLPVAGKPLIEYTIEALVAEGITDLVINLSHLGKQIQQAIGNGAQFNATINYSDEGDSALETAGGIIHALPLLGDAPFLVVNGDIASDYAFGQLKHKHVDLAHLVLIPNPEHHPEGDFGLENGRVRKQASEYFTFSGIGIYHPDLFAQTAPGKSKLGPLLREAMQQNRISGELHTGFWMDIGTPERLIELEKYYKNT
jgi:MurNAc alpha-1-phosphate uridylyltransferase